MADKEKLQEERKTGGPRMLRPGLGSKERGMTSKELNKKPEMILIIDGKKYDVQNMAKGGRAGYRMGGKCKLAKRGKGRAYGKNS